MRAPRLPDVFASRGHAPLPDDWHRPRPGLRLMGLGVAVSLFAGLGLGAVGYGAVAVWLVVVGPRQDAPAVAVASVACAVGAVLGVRVRTVLVRRWIAAEDARRLEPGGG
ncbi:hypothetical protein [Patulibacter sp.]|uniref:hypothetical protein n=1 Tax=Patulibacter sp. TaxID=1912859 RepID=UPI00271FF8B8|nr:hypothetical protein [Patulibacter sp.]MDO9410800.1 hypothetical protein [Patulibacter sp.]